MSQLTTACICILLISGLPFTKSLIAQDTSRLPLPLLPAWFAFSMIKLFPITFHSHQAFAVPIYGTLSNTYHYLQKDRPYVHSVNFVSSFIPPKLTYSFSTLYYNS